MTEEIKYIILALEMSYWHRYPIHNTSPVYPEHYFISQEECRSCLTYPFRLGISLWYHLFSCSRPRLSNTQEDKTDDFDLEMLSPTD